MIQQLTEKLFAIEVTEESNLYLDLKQGERMKGMDWEFIYLGSVSKDTIDFDVEPYVETKPYGDYPFFCTIDYMAKPHKNGFRPGFCADTGRQYTDYFRSLLTSKGCNPDEKHLIIEKV